MKTRPSRRRGSSLIEVMIAAAVLLVGLVGIVQLMISGMTAVRDARVKMTATVQSNSGLANLAAMPYASLSAGTFDGGTYVGTDGRSYARTLELTQCGDAGVGAYRIVVTTAWTDFLGRARTAQSAVIVSETPDASL